MAGLSHSKGAWRVTWIDDGRKAGKQFQTELAAREFMKENGLSHVCRRRRNRAQVIDHLAANFEVDDNGCWIWTSSLNNAGYARMTWKEDGLNTVPGAHRVVLHAIGQPVPTDKVVDHLCRNRACINPDHLDVVQQRENVMRSPVAIGALNAGKTHCAQGHPYDEANTYVWRSTTRSTTTRICKTCQRSYQERRKARRAVSA